jgi:UDPglucose 6-dehydrogenase
MPAFIADRIIRAAGNDQNARIGILGLSFKPGSDDVRDAPSAKIIRQLIERGYKNVYAFDPVANEEFASHYDLAMTYCGSVKETIDNSDLLVIATAWPDFKEIHSLTEKPVVDCRYML